MKKKFYVVKEFNIQVKEISVHVLAPCSVISNLIDVSTSDWNLETISATLLLVRLHDEGFVDVRNNTTSGDSSLNESVKLLITSDGEQQVSRSDSLHFEILRGVSCKFKDFCSKVFKDCSTVDS